MGTLANSEDPDKMPKNVVFYSGSALFTYIKKKLQGLKHRFR